MGSPTQHVSVHLPMTDQGAFLQPSLYCDWQHPAIQQLMRNLTTHARSERDAARELFTWVRDHILFRVGHWNATASDTLAEREGTCSNKANLMVALARASGIPAAYYVQKVRGRNILALSCPSRCGGGLRLAPRTYTPPCTWVVVGYDVIPLMIRRLRSIRRT
jgi:transglutaminase-like putative cysteine protease